MSNERTPLLPQRQQDHSALVGRRKINRSGVKVVFCACLGLIGVGIFLCRSKENPKLTQIPSRASDQNLSLNFLVVGDWGRHGLYNQSILAEQMGRIGNDLGIAFVISTGDNFYDTGLTSADDPAFTSSFTDVYTASSLQTMWYTVLGNHDYMGDAVAQLSDELVRRDSRWFCRRSFQLNYTLCDGSSEGSCDASVDMFFFDTTPFIDEYWSANNTQFFNWTGLAPRSMQLQSQLDDLQRALNSSIATWKIVVGHHTIRSIGHHGDSAELIQMLLPILEEYEVDAYINGHDHNVQHIKRADCSVHFFTSGGGSKAYSGLSSYTEEQGVLYANDGQGFLAVRMSPQSMVFNLYDVSGDAAYSFLLQK